MFFLNFLKTFWRRSVLFVGPLIPLFWTSGDISFGCQSQSGQPYSHLVEAYVLHIPWDSPLVQHPLTSWSAEPFSSMCLWTSFGGAWNQNLRQMFNWLSYVGFSNMTILTLCYEMQIKSKHLHIQNCFTTLFVTLRTVLVVVSMTDNWIFYFVGKYFFWDSKFSTRASCFPSQRSFLG